MKNLGKYELLEQLSTGSMGTIHLGRDTVLDRQVALKVIMQGASVDPELKERFQREARACARLQHPSIITVYDFGEQDGTAYIAMELLRGIDVRGFIAEKRFLPIDRKLDTIAKVCDGLAHAHKNDIVHRDIKPSNIFLPEEGGVKILDFGIARMAASNLTMMGRVLGTPNYMAPEQILGKPCDARSDLFSAAIVFYEFLSGLHPFRGESIPKRIMREEASPLLGADPSLPASLETILAKALTKDPAGRYQSAAELASALRGAVGQISPATSTHELRPSTAGVPSSVAPPREGEGTEVRMGVLLTSLQAFDEAIDHRDGMAARAAFERLKAAAANDERFSVAVRESTNRLRELEASLPPPQPAAPAMEAAAAATSNVAPVAEPPAPRAPAKTPDPAPAPAPPPVPPPSAPARAQSFGGDATTLFAPPTGAQAPPAPIARAPQPLAEQVKTPPRQAAPRPQAQAQANNNKGLIVALGSVAAVLILAAGAFFFVKGRKHSAQPVPAVAIAYVAAAEAKIHVSPGDDQEVIATAKKGEKINVIRPPNSSAQEWTEVQYLADGVATPVAYAKTADLTNWSSSDPETEYSLIRTFAPRGAAGAGELQRYLDRLNALFPRLAGKPAEAEAHLEAARAGVLRAQLAKNAGQARWRKYAADAWAHLAKAAVRTDLADRVKQVRDDLSAAGASAAAPSAHGAEPPPDSPPAPPVASIPPAVLVSRAEALWRDGRYRDAERILTRVLREDPELQPAKDLLLKVRKAKEAEGNHE